jgi:uncharacterized tellurite resistance protein B-like protein
MHIILGLAALLGTVGVILWRVNQASEAARGLVDTADDVRGFLRRRKWQKKLASDTLQLIDDPRVAAAVMMVTLAQHDGAVTQAEQNVIINQMMEKFRSTASVADELFAHARWIARDVVDVDSCFRRVTHVVEKACGPAEREQLIEMLTAVANAGEGLGDAERLAFDRLKRVLRNQG